MSVDGMLSFRIVRMAQNLERAGRVAVGGGGCAAAAICKRNAHRKAA